MARANIDRAKWRDSSELLERSDYLSALDAVLVEVVSGGRGRLVLVRGEAGVGKTALVRRFCGELGSSARVLWGNCDPLFTPRPLGPLFDVAEATEGELEELVQTGAKAHDVTAALVRELGSHAPTVLVLEDVHWADEATLDVVRMLARRIATVAGLVIASYRDDELDRDHALRIVLGDFATDRTIRRLKIEPLSPSAVTRLAEQHRVDPDKLYRKTAGNPFFVTEVLAARGDEIPSTVRDAVFARAGRLSVPARALLEAIAALPQRAELWLLEGLAADAIGHLEECLVSGMLTAEATAAVAFRHELARRAVEESLAPDRRIALHRMALELLADPPAGALDHARLAHHAEAAGDARAVLRYAPQAGARAALVGAHREAAAQYARALRFADEGQLALRADLLSRRSAECYLTSQLDEAIGAQQEALDCHRRLGDMRREGNALRVLSRLLFFAGRASEAEPLVVQAIELLEQQPAGHELAMAYANLSQRRMVVDDAAAAVEWGHRALELGRALGDTEVEAYALSNIAAAEFRTNAAEGRRKLEAALALAQHRGHEEHAALTFNRLVMFPVRYRRYDIALDHLAAGLEYCTERGLDTFRLYLLGSRARLELDLGRWDAAADSASLVLRDPRSAQLARTWALTALGLLRSRRGDAEATALLAEAHALATPTFELDRLAQVAAARAEAAWLSGDHTTVRLVTDAALRLALDRRDPWAVGELACWRWRAGFADEPPPGAAKPYARQISGDWQRAAELWQAIGCPYEAALALAEADDQQALRRALDELQSLGASPAAAIVARRLRRRGARGLPRGPRKATRENPYNLTAREVEVLELVAQGLGNPEIANRLFLSEKTVAHHVSAILRKLDVRTRGQAGAQAVRLGLAAQDR